MATRKDLYAVLGVAKNADEDALRKAYRKLARQLHPDVNPGDSDAEERFKEVSEAYAVLSDPERRRNYDEFGEISLESGFDAEKARQAREAFGRRFGAGAGGGGFPFRGGDAGGEEAFHFDNLEDLLSQAFAGGRARRGPSGLRGADVEAELELDFLDAVRGGEQRLTLARGGLGGGTEAVTVRIPAGVADGGRIRIRGKGAPGIGDGPPGDLWARIRVRPHAVFRRDGRDLLIDLPITVSEAVKGAKVEIPTLEGRATVTIPPGTDSGQKLRLRGKGVPDPSGGPPGDLYAVVQIRVPRNLDEEARRKLDQLAVFEPEDPRQELFR